MGAELVTVRVRDCACPDAPHPEGDVVFLTPTLGIEGGAAAELDLLEVSGNVPENRRDSALLVRWTATFVRYGAVGWNWLRLDDKGKPEPIPFDAEVLVADYTLARLVAGRANELYREAVLAPLVAAVPRSPTGRTGGSTSRTRTRTQKPSGSSSRPASDGPQLRVAR